VRLPCIGLSSVPPWFSPHPEFPIRGKWHEITRGRRIKDLGSVVLVYRKFVHKPMYDVKHDVNVYTVSVWVPTLGWHTALNRRRMSGIALQSERAILEDLFSGH